MPNSPNHWWFWIKKFAILVGIFLALSFIAGTIIMIKISGELPDPNKLSDRPIAQSTKIYDRTGQHLLREVYQDKKRTLVELNQIAPVAIQAVIATEDKHFYEHRGVRILSILRAGFNNMIGRRAGSGGASTLTQQLVKNVLVGSERTFFRKIKEALLAVKAEQQYSKDEILKLYLNEVPFGSTNYGIEAASQSYFQKNAQELTLSEAATIAGLIQRPSVFLNDPEALTNRRNLVLKLMQEQGYISEEEKNQAQSSPLNLNRGKGVLEAPHFVFYVEDQLENILGKNNLSTGGYKVYTSLDFDKQKMAESLVKQYGDKFAKENNANNAALVAMDPKTGQVLVMVGSRDYYNNDIDGQFNAALSRNRQPGSSLKPFVYLAAFEKGYTPETVLYDVRVNFPQKNGPGFFPKNATNQEYGQITMRKALQGSLNIPAVKTMYLLGYDQTIDYLTSRFNYSTLKDAYYGLSLVIGGAQIVPLEHTAAYAALANNGVYLPPQSILKIENDGGEIIYQAPPPQGKEATSPEFASLMSNILSDNQARAFIFGSKNNLTLPDRPVAAKTGTTNDNKDAWTMGYVPSLAVGVWVGNTKPSPMRGGGEGLAGIIWNQFMRSALKDTPPDIFSAPPPNDATKPILRGSDGGLKLKVNSMNGKIATSSTPPQLMVEKTFLVPHDILHYIDRNDPRGPEPLNPQDDPLYQNWENALQAWVKKQQEQGKNVTLDTVPTEYDDTHPQFGELTPTINILFPQEGQIITNRNLAIRISASAPRGVTQASFQIDGFTIGTSRESPFSFDYFAQNLSVGEHTLGVVVVDDQGNWATREIHFSFTPEVGSTDFQWDSSSPMIVSASHFPRLVSISPQNWDDVKNIKVFLVSPTENKLIYTFDHNDKLTDNKLSFTWKRVPAKGSYTLKGIMTNKQGDVVEKNLAVEIN